jgi:hypothetical protein
LTSARILLPEFPTRSITNEQYTRLRDRFEIVSFEIILFDPLEFKDKRHGTDRLLPGRLLTSWFSTRLTLGGFSSCLPLCSAHDLMQGPLVSAWETEPNFFHTVLEWFASYVPCLPVAVADQTHQQHPREWVPRGAQNSPEMVVLQPWQLPWSSPPIMPPRRFTADDRYIASDRSSADPDSPTLAPAEIFVHTSTQRNHNRPRSTSTNTTPFTIGLLEKIATGDVKRYRIT